MRDFKLFLPRRVCYSWCFDPSEPQRIISGLKTNFNLCPSYSIHKLFSHKTFFLKPQLSVKYFIKNPTQTAHLILYRTHKSLSETEVKIITTIQNCQPRKNNNTCSRVYFIFRGHSTRESASIIWNDEQGDLFYSAGPHWNQC